MRRIVPRRYVMAVACLATYAPLKAETLIIQPDAEDGKDVSLYERTDIPVSAGPSLYAINTGPPGPGFDDFASLVEFDLAGVSSTADSIASARLWLYENDVPTFSFLHVSPEFPNVIEVRPAATPWTETSVFFSTLPEPMPGHSAVQSVDGVNQWFSWDVTDVVRAWLDGALANNGFLITSQVEVRDNGLVVGSAFDASEQNNPPYLEIEIMDSQPGDYDLDGDVDGHDLLELLLAFGSAAIPPGSGADGNNDGLVNRADVNVWRENVGSGISPAGRLEAVTVPEPPAWSLMGLAVAFLAACRQGFPKMRRSLATAAALLAVVAATPVLAPAITVPFTEEFDIDAANWKDFANEDVSYFATGGASGAGDGFISVQRTFTANPDFAQTVFRAQDGFDSSSDALVGDWLAAGASRFSFFVRHNAASDLTFGTRFATSANTPGANGIGVPGVVPPDVWTLVELPISPANVIPEGPPSLFPTVFGSVGNVQISARPGNNLNVPITFDLDRVSLVPEPSNIVLIGIAAVATFLGVRRRRCVATAGPFVLAIAFVLPPVAAQEIADESTVHALSPLPEPLASFGAASHDGWLYVYGGHVGETHDHSRENVRGSFRRQPLDGGSWEELPGGPAVQSPALIAHGAYLYRIGGLTALNAPDDPADLRSVSSVARFSPKSGVWEELAPLPQPRSSHDAVVIGDKVFVAGGWNHHGEEGEAEWHDSTLVLDLEKSALPRWEQIAPAPFKRRALALASLDGRVYCIGGMCPDGSRSRRVDIYDLQTNTWTRGPHLPQSDLNGFGSSAFEVGGRLFTSSRSDVLLALSPHDTAWASVASLEQPRFFHRIVPGANGTVLLIAGAGYDGHLNTIDVLPAARRTSQTAE